MDPDGMWPDWFDNAVKQTKSVYNATVKEVKSAYNSTVSQAKSVYKQTAAATVKAGTEIKNILLNIKKNFCGRRKNCKTRDKNLNLPEV
jgi:hypothetical protein